MKPTLPDFLVCPIDRKALEVTGGSRTAHGELLDGSLVCEQGHEFPIADGLPDLSPASIDATQEDTADSFGAKWGLHTDDDNARLTRYQYSWYDERYGWGDETGLAQFLSGKERILDAGCGLGRDVARYTRLSGAQVIGVDLSDAVELAHQQFGGAPNAHFLRGDILALPFAPRSFDFVVADQVIHHTPDAAAAFDALASLVCPGGQIAVYVYRKKAMLRELADDHIRELTTRLSVEACMEFSAQLAELGRELSRVGGTVTLERGVPLLGIAPGQHDAQRLIYWHLLKCFWNDEYGEHLSTLVNFDWYHPPYASRHTPEEVEAWCRDAGFEVAHLGVIDSGISVRAIKP